MILDTYLEELNKQDLNNVKIHPKRKTAMSVAALANPADDVLFGAMGAGSALKAAKDASKLKKFGAAAGGIAIGVAMSAALIAGYRLIRSKFDRCTKECGTYTVNKPKRQLCMLQCKKVNLQNEIILLRKEKKPQKIPKIQNKLAIVNRKIVLMNQYLKKGTKDENTKRISR